VSHCRACLARLRCVTSRLKQIGWLRGCGRKGRGGQAILDRLAGEMEFAGMRRRYYAPHNAAELVAIGLYRHTSAPIRLQYDGRREQPRSPYASHIPEAFCIVVVGYHQFKTRRTPAQQSPSKSEGT